jgi:hypothetical protein
MRPIYLFFLPFLISLTAVGCERNPRSGARISEDPKGQWLWMCTTRVTGPKKAAITLKAQGQHKKKGVALSLALANACRSSADHDACLVSSGGYKRLSEDCHAVNKKAASSPMKCSVTLRQPDTIPTLAWQGEGATQKSACRRAAVTACRMLQGGARCTRAEQGWTHTTTIARRRPVKTGTP